MAKGPALRTAGGGGGGGGVALARGPEGARAAVREEREGHPQHDGRGGRAEHDEGEARHEAAAAAQGVTALAGRRARGLRQPPPAHQRVQPRHAAQHQPPTSYFKDYQKAHNCDGVCFIEELADFPTFGNISVVSWAPQAKNSQRLVGGSDGNFTAELNLVNFAKRKQRLSTSMLLILLERMMNLNANFGFVLGVPKLVMVLWSLAFSCTVTVLQTMPCSLAESWAQCTVWWENVAVELLEAQHRFELQEYTVVGQEFPLHDSHVYCELHEEQEEMCWSCASTLGGKMGSVNSVEYLYMFSPPLTGMATGPASGIPTLVTTLSLPVSESGPYSSSQSKGLASARQASRTSAPSVIRPDVMTKSCTSVSAICSILSLTSEGGIMVFFLGGQFQNRLRGEAPAIRQCFYNFIQSFGHHVAKPINPSYL
ncbi:Protein of unknown function [Gryllus bimaculatus]|nr:Protein of unknown function [Gryllus bimaculatus]